MGISIKGNNNSISKGKTLDKVGKFQEAIKMFDRAIEMNSIHAIAYSEKGEWDLY